MKSNKSLNCPKCQKPASDFSLTPQLSVNRCLSCNVVWFDKDELGLWFHFDEVQTIASVKLPSSLESPLVPILSTPLKNVLCCPRCTPTEQLTALQLIDQMIYRCQTCLGHLVSMEGLKKFKGYKPILGTSRLSDLHAKSGPSRLIKDGIDLRAESQILIKQKRELAELVGIETRNKYEIYGSSSQLMAFAAEQGGDLLSFLSRTFFGHWRSFQIIIFGHDRIPQLRLNHPFRFFLPCLECQYPNGGPLGIIQQKFSLFSKKIEVTNTITGHQFWMSSPIWRPWRFPFHRGLIEVATAEKKFSGLFSEVFTDKDNFLLTFADPKLTNDDRLLLLSASIFIDLIYFEKKASS